jgi:hypothetical protein
MYVTESTLAHELVVDGSARLPAIDLNSLPDATQLHLVLRFETSGTILLRLWSCRIRSFLGHTVEHERTIQGRAGEQQRIAISLAGLRMLNRPHVKVLAVSGCRVLVSAWIQ